MILNSPSLSGNEMFVYSVRKVLRLRFRPGDNKKTCVPKISTYRKHAFKMFRFGDRSHRTCRRKAS